MASCPDDGIAADFANYSHRRGYAQGMPTPVFLTIDTEFAWRHHSAGHDVATIHALSLEPAEVGLAWQLETLSRYDLRAVFFVDPMPALIYGLDPVRRIVDQVLAAGQDVQLHFHAQWAGASAEDRLAHGRFELIDYSLPEQLGLLSGALDLLVAAGAPRPVAFRAGSYSANDDTLAALVDLGIRYDSSHNGAEHPWPSALSLSPRQIAPLNHSGLIEVPVTTIEDQPGHLRNFQICALSGGEMRAALEHAVAGGHGAVTIVGHSFELANRAGTRANAIHVGRFKALCTMLAEMREMLPTLHFADEPRLALGRGDAPLGPSTLRRRWRQAEQLWSNIVEERAA